MSTREPDYDDVSSSEDNGSSHTDESLADPVTESPFSIAAGSPPSSPNQALHQVERVRWWVIILVIALGTLLTGVSVITSVAFNWQGIWPQVFLGWGTTIALGAALFGVQRIFVYNARVQAAASEQRIQQQFAQFAEEIESRLTDGDTRLEDVAGLAEQVRETRYAREDRLVAALSTNINYDTVTEALAFALQTGAIDKRFRIRIGHHLDGLRIQFKMTTKPKKESALSGLSPWLPVDEPDLSGISLKWESDESIVLLLDRLREKIEEKSTGKVGRKEWDEDFALANLTESLRVAMQSRRGQLKRRLGPLIELVNKRWAITEKGLESRTTDEIVSVSDAYKLLDKFESPLTNFTRLKKPFWIRRSQWKALLTLTVESFPASYKPIIW
jgi:hypothetical protein